MATINPRKGHILRFIVSDYVMTALPVASNTVARTSGLKVSSATVRNEMVALEGDGYIHRPHISAGGVPSEKGYRYYVDNLDRAGVASEDAAALGAALGQVQADLASWAESAAHSLSSLLGTLAFATPLRAPAAAIKGIELLRLQESIVLLILILREASVHREIISLDRPVTGPEVEHARNRVSEQVSGKTVSDVEAALANAAGPLDYQVLESAADALRRREAEAYGERVFQGLSRLLAQPELAAHPEQASHVVTIMEDTGAFAATVRQAPDGVDPGVLIGSETNRESLREFSVIVGRYGVPGEAQGTMGVIGPTRMRYGRAIPAVKYASEALSGFASRVYGA